MTGNMLAFLMIIALVKQDYSPVSWNYTAIKKADKVYEIHLTAKVNSPWSIYSQTTPEGGPLPTKINFSKNPLVVLDGKTKEAGVMKKKYEEVFETEVYYYKDKVDFVQTVKLKTNVKTNIGGTIEFMACNDEQCLPPATVHFSVDLK